ncbi:DUF4007 family protein [Acinetobacter baumannii]|uniref:DUF4007 family protein n=1 Tax=Acinetobacter baumannii TaxID=470 RepID=UPI00300C5749
MNKINFPSTMKPMFSGHETFPLRQLWLKKAYHQVFKFYEADSDYAPKTVFSAPDAIERFGVGKNMVAAIKHWALACDVIREHTDKNGFEIGEIGYLLFDEKSGVDQYLESEATLWLLHWLLAGRARRTATIYSIYNFIQNQTFTELEVKKLISDLALSNQKGRSDVTLSTDITTSMKCYFSSHDTEDNIEPLLAGIGLLSEISKGQYRFNRGNQYSLPDQVFAFALLDFWEQWELITNTSQKTLSFNLIAHDYGSPGRVFKLDESAVGDRLSRISEITNNYLQWTDSSGIRQVSRIGTETLGSVKMRILRGAYE